jgi:hypothetical protein
MKRLDHSAAWYFHRCALCGDVSSASGIHIQSARPAGKRAVCAGSSLCAICARIATAGGKLAAGQGGNIINHKTTYQDTFR